MSSPEASGPVSVCQPISELWQRQPPTPRCPRGLDAVFHQMRCADLVWGMQDGRDGRVAPQMSVSECEYILEPGEDLKTPAALAF